MIPTVPSSSQTYLAFGKAATNENARKYPHTNTGRRHQSTRNEPKSMLVKSPTLFVCLASSSRLHLGQYKPGQHSVRVAPKSLESSKSCGSASRTTSPLSRSNGSSWILCLRQAGTRGITCSASAQRSGRIGPFGELPLGAPCWHSCPRPFPVAYQKWPPSIYQKYQAAVVWGLYDQQ